MSFDPAAAPGTPADPQTEPTGGQPEAAPATGPAQPAPSAPSGEPTAPAPADAPAGAGQPFQTDPPTEPADSTTRPRDALEPLPGQDASTQPPQITGGVPVREDAPDPDPSHVGPEDALDPHAENRGDYTGRVDDAIHIHHEQLPPEEQTVGGPLTRPVAQNTLAEEHLDTLSGAGGAAQEEDPGARQARERVQAEQDAAGSSGERGQAEE